MKISAGIANLEDMLENVEHQKIEEEVKLVLNKLRELKLLTDTTFYDQLQDVMTLRKEKNAPSLAKLRKELDEALRKHHHKMELERLGYKEEK